MPTDDRDQQFERALARLLRDASPESPCPDAEILSAYHERTLAPEEMALWKEHIAGCAPCQEVLAVVERSEDVHAEEWEKERVTAAYEAAPLALRTKAPEIRAQEAAFKPAAPMAAVAFRRALPRPRWSLLVPIGALAAGVIAWVGVREVQVQRRNQAASVQMARNQQTTPSLISPQSSSGDPLRDEMKAREQRQKQSPLENQTKKDEPPVWALENGARDKKIAPVMPQRSPRAREAAPGAGGVPSPAANPQAFSLEGRNDTKVVTPSPRPSFAGAAKTRDAEKAATPQPSPPAAVGDAVGQAPVPGKKQKEELPRGATETIVVEGAPPPAPQQQQKPEAPGRASQSVEVQSAAAPVDTITSSTSVELSRQVLPELNFAALAKVDRRYVVAPGEKNIWRVGDAGKIERSTDHGKTWKIQESGVSADLTAGSATSEKICWVVGKAGTILLTTNGGKHWKIIPPPIPDDLGGIHATDATHTSVWDVPNRNSFETSDGGVTWNRITPD